MLAAARQKTLLKILVCNSISNLKFQRLMQQINVKCRYNVGYSNNYLNPFSYKGIANFTTDGNTGFAATFDITSEQFEKISEETLDSLSEYFDELIERAGHLSNADVSYGSGVLTVKFGNSYGTYVINRQVPNKQIWLSSPKSGPKRYDFINGKWIYKHDGRALHDLLNDEIPAIIRDQTDFNKCSFSGKEREAAEKRI